MGDDLDQLGWAASKLWNVGRYYADERWDATGEIPDDMELKGHERYTDLHLQSSQRVRLSKGRNLKEHRSDFFLCESRTRPDVDLTEWVVPMTTTRSQYPFVVILRESDEDVDKDSAVQLDQIRTVDIEKRVERTAGHVSDGKMAEIDAAIKVSLGLD